ncbi:MULTISPECIES: mechanosensitive ion channel family protein [Novosphingobium]|uniref:mechanosensitive ion channel family protein n=1 Tax=Novosphingobium TaxID=165696 RepID=UPI002329E3D3|nr:hypothetical protein GCM10017612_07270 [Novosphingobium resinovorum]
MAGSLKKLTYGDSEGRIVLPVGVAYGSEPEKVRKLLADIAVSHEKVLGDPPPRVVIDTLGDNAINLNLLCFLGDVNQRMTVRSDLYFAIIKALDEAGISIPYPQRELWLHDARMPQAAKDL